VCSEIALYRRTGTLTSPKLIEPVQIALGISCLCPPKGWEKRRTHGTRAFRRRAGVFNATSDVGNPFLGNDAGRR
jgi:hypothetical protein